MGDVQLLGVGVQLLAGVQFTDATGTLPTSGVQLTDVGVSITPQTDEAEWPDETNTGVPPGTVLTPMSGDLHTTVDGQIIDSIWLTSGTIFVEHDNVIIQRSLVDTTGFRCVWSAGGTTTGTIVRDCELKNAQFGVFGAEVTVLRCNIHGVEDGVVCSGGHDVTVQDNFIHDPQTVGDVHGDGIVNDGGSNNLLVVHNHVVGAWSTAALSIRTGLSTGCTIRNNWLEGGAYVVYITDAQTDVTLEDNLLGFSVNSNGYYNFTGLDPAELTKSGNVSNRGMYLDGQIPPVEGLIAFQPSNPLTVGNANPNLGLRNVCTLIEAGTEFRLILYPGSDENLTLDGVAIGKQLSGADSALPLLEVPFGGITTAALVMEVDFALFVASDWVTAPAPLIVGDKMFSSIRTGHAGGLGFSGSNTNATTFFGTAANYADAVPGYGSQSTNNCFGVYRIETRG